MISSDSFVKLSDNKREILAIQRVCVKAVIPVLLGFGAVLSPAFRRLLKKHVKALDSKHGIIKDGARNRRNLIVKKYRQRPAGCLVGVPPTLVKCESGTLSRQPPGRRRYIKACNQIAFSGENIHKE
jgi:hypothetical protein